MKLILCTKCADVVALSRQERACDCGRSAGAYEEDGHRAWVVGPCTVYGLDNRVFVLGRGDAFLYPMENGRVERRDGRRTSEPIPACDWYAMEEEG